MDYNILKVTAEDLKRKPPRLEVIKWKDHSAFITSSWKHMDDIVSLAPVIIYTAGWIVYEDKEKLIVVAHTDKSANGTNQGEFCIVKNAIESRWTIKDPSTPTIRKRRPKK